VSEKSDGIIVWFTGLSGSGKTTLAKILVDRFRAMGRRVELLDGDVVRTNLSKGLGFSKEDRDTNIRRIGFVAHLLQRNGVIAICAAISPYQAIRDEIRATADGSFVEIFADCPIDTCAQRDGKQEMYAKARSGELPNFTGVSDPYEPPASPDIWLKTSEATPEACAEQILAFLADQRFLSYSGSTTSR